jgi:hypothetical protein
LERPDGLQVWEGKFYLADVGYACRACFFYPSCQQGIISMNSLQDTTQKCLRRTLQPASDNREGFHCSEEHV